jgi:FdhE protein
MAGDLKMKLARMEQIKREKPAYRNLLDFYEKIFIAKEEFYQSLKTLSVVFDEQEVQTKFKAGFPVLDKSAIELDSGALENFFRTLLQISHKKNPDTAEKLHAFIKKGNLDVGNTIKAMWGGETPSPAGGKEELGDPTLLFFLLTESLKPFYEYLAENLRAVIDVTLWGKGYCPICGKTPSIAAIPEGKWSRHLFCVYCGTEWPFPFLMCPFCGNEEEEGVTYLYVENEKQYRLEVCKACQKYLKAVDIECIGTPVPLDVENIATLHLDILAQREGYGRGAHYPLLI